METAIRTSGSFVRTEYGVMVECLKCGHVGVLSPKALSRAGLSPSTPIAAFVKRLRRRRCEVRACLPLARLRQRRPLDWGRVA